MGVQTQAFVAHPDEVVVFEGGPEPPDDVLKGLDTVKLGALGQLLLEGVLETVDEGSYGAVYDGLTKEMHDAMHTFDSGEEWAFHVPERLTGALAELSDERLPELAETWSQTEEFEADSKTAEDADEYLRELRSKAGAAQDSQKQLFLWMSL